MQAIEHILMSAQQEQEQQEQASEQKRLQALEAKAVAEAAATADAAFTPSPSLMNAKTPEPLLKQVDGPSMDKYEGKESVYVGRSVPVSAGGALTVPIQVTTPGSVVEYVVENKQYDFGFAVTAEREEGVTVVKEETRVDASKAPVTGKFLVGSVPCLIQFKFINDFSWYREKVLSYKVTVTPPALETLTAGRRRRAQSCLKAVSEDMISANKRYTSTTEQKEALEKEVEELEKLLEQKKRSIAAAEKEEAWLKERVSLRKIQKEGLEDRLNKGWPDERKDGAEQ